MLTWPHSTVVTDLKREIYELTAGWRGTEGNNRISRFEPASSSHPRVWARDPPTAHSTGRARTSNSATQVAPLPPRSLVAADLIAILSTLHQRLRQIGNPRNLHRAPNAECVPHNPSRLPGCEQCQASRIGSPPSHHLSPPPGEPSNFDGDPIR